MNMTSSQTCPNYVLKLVGVSHRSLPQHTLTWTSRPCIPELSFKYPVYILSIYTGQCLHYYYPNQQKDTHGKVSTCPAMLQNKDNKENKESNER